MTKPFIPKVIPTKNKPTAAMLAWAQGHADAAYQRLRDGEDALETDAVEICASQGPVPRHRDDEFAERGMRIIGLVLRSDGHRLHSDNLHLAGITEGLPLSPGDLYQIDPRDPHWTTVPDGAVKAELIFTVYIMKPDGRTPQRLAKDFWMSVLVASIESMRNPAAA